MWRCPTRTRRESNGEDEAARRTECRLYAGDWRAAARELRIARQTEDVANCHDYSGGTLSGMCLAVALERCDIVREDRRDECEGHRGVLFLTSITGGDAHWTAVPRARIRRMVEGCRDLEQNAILLCMLTGLERCPELSDEHRLRAECDSYGGNWRLAAVRANRADEGGG